MSDDDALSRLETATEEIADRAGGHVDAVQLPDGEWVVAIEPSGERHGEWAVRSGGPTKAKALSNLVKEAKAHGLT